MRGIQVGAGESAAMLRAGDVLTCRARTADRLIIQRAGCDEMAIHRHDTIRVLMEDGGRD